MFFTIEGLRDWVFQKWLSSIIGAEPNKGKEVRAEVTFLDVYTFMLECSGNCSAIATTLSRRPRVHKMVHNLTDVEVWISMLSPY